MLDISSAADRSQAVHRPGAKARALAWMLALSVVAGAGCGGSNETLLGSYLNQLEFDAPLEATSSVSLGEFDLPAAATFGNGADTRTVWMRIKFELVAETLPNNESAVQQAYERRRGALCDAVLRVIRTSSTDEFTDPRSSALKLRLNETIRPLLGEDIVRQLVLYKYRTEGM